MDSTHTNKAYLSLAATSILWGTTWVASRVGVQQTPGLEVSYIRQFIAGSLILIFFFIAISFGYLMAQKTQLAINILILICGLAVLLMCLLNTETGLYIIMVFSFFAFHVSRYFNDTIPVGALSDILIFTTLFSFFVKRKGLRSIINEFSQKPVVKILLIIYAYTAIQLFNPNAQSFDSWYQGFRKVISTLFIFFIAELFPFIWGNS